MAAHFGNPPKLMENDMTRCILIALCAAALCGCSRATFTKTGMTGAQEDREWKECNYEAQKAASDNKGYLISQCMELRGYKWDGKLRP